MPFNEQDDRDYEAMLETLSSAQRADLDRIAAEAAADCALEAARRRANIAEARTPHEEPKD